MSKISKNQHVLDRKKVLQELQYNAKDTIDQIAKRCGFSRQKVWRIIKQLEKEKAIWGYRAVADNEKFQMNRYVLLFKKTNKPMSELVSTIISRELEKKVKTIGITIESSSYLNGSFDWMIIFTAVDIWQAKQFVDIFHKVYPNVVAESFLLEELFPIKTSGLVNPNMDRFKEFS